MELYIIQNNGTADAVLGRVNNLQAAIAIFAALVAASPTKHAVIKENNTTIVMEYKVGSPQ